MGDFPPIGSVGTGLLQTPQQQKFPPVGRVGDGFVSGTPLSPVKTFETSIDPTITPEQEAAYNLKQQMMRQMRGEDQGLLGNAKNLALQIAPALVGGTAASTLAKVPGLVGAALRTLAAGGGAGVTDLALSGDPASAMRTGVTTGLFQAGGEGLAGMRNARNFREQQAPLKAEYRNQQEQIAAYRKAMAEHEQKLASAKATEGATNIANAANIADDVKQLVPAWRQYPSTAEGISEMIGPGWKGVKADFDAALQASKAQARGQTLMISERDARALKLETMPDPKAGPTRILNEQAKSGLSPRTIPDEVRVDAEQAIDAITGKSRGVTAGAYHRVVRQLDEMGIGSQEARDMYYNALGFRVFARRNHIAEGGTLHPEKVERGIDSMPERGAPDITQGPMDPVLRETRTTPMPTEPRAPVFESPVEMSVKKSPLTALPVKLGTGVALSAATGMPHWYSHAAGSTVASGLPGKPIYTAPPFSSLGGETGLGVPVGSPTTSRLLGTAAAQGTNAAARAAGWDYILENLVEDAKPAPKPSPLRPAKVTESSDTTDDEER